jgi:hypothetical protein
LRARRSGTSMTEKSPRNGRNGVAGTSIREFGGDFSGRGYHSSLLPKVSLTGGQAAPGSLISKRRYVVRSALKVWLRWFCDSLEPSAPRQGKISLLRW